MTRGRAPRAIDFGLSQILLAGVAGLTMAAVPSVPRLLLEARQLPDLGFGEVLGLKAGLAAIILLPLSIVAGVGTPLLLAALAHSTERPGRVIGRAYMINTAGTLLGSLAAGFFLVERLGTQGTLRAAAILSLGIGLAGVLPSVFGARLALRIGSVVASLLVAALVIGEARWPVMTFLLSDTRGQHSVATNRLAIESQLRLAPTELLYFAEGRDATVGVTAWGNRTLYVNGHPDASDHLDMATQLMLSVVPLVAEPSPEDVLVVGFGSGVSASAATRVPEVKHVDVVELEEAVLAASPSFHHVNHAVESDPRVRLIRDDARSVLVAPPRLYDAIISEPSNPWRAGVASLFTMEFYRSARAALKPGGVFAQWVQLYGLDERTLRMVLQTLSSSFPELQIWWLDPGNIVVLGSSVPLPIDPARVTRLVGGEFRADLARYAWIGADDEFYGRFLVGTGDVRAWLDDGSQQVTENTDDLPLLEFEAPRGLFLGDGQNALRLVALKLLRGAMLPPLVRGRPSAAAVWSSIATIYRTAHRLPEARIAMDHAMGAERSARLLAGAAELALEAGDLRAAEALLADAAALPADPRSPQGAIDAQRVIEMTALLRAKQRRLADAVAILDTASDLDGRLGVPRLRALVALRRGDDALKQAERLLSHARLGGEIDAMEVEQIYLALGDLGASHAATVAALTSLIDRFPLPGLPSFPREKALAGLCRMGADPTQALAHAHQALVGGALDLKLFEIEIWALGQLGRYGEADELRALRRTLNPASAVEPVASPLLEKSQERALERAPDPPRPSDGDAEVATPPAAHP